MIGRKGQERADNCAMVARVVGFFLALCLICAYMSMIEAANNVDQHLCYVCSFLFVFLLRCVPTINVTLAHCHLGHVIAQFCAAVGAGWDPHCRQQLHAPSRHPPEQWNEKAAVNIHKTSMAKMRDSYTMLLAYRKDHFIKEGL